MSSQVVLPFPRRPSLSNPRMRFDIEAISEQDFGRLNRAFLALDRMDAIPFIYKRFACIHPEFAEHGFPLFLPWHRAYVLLLEDALGLVGNCGDLGIPYWDWARPLLAGKPIELPTLLKKEEIDGSPNFFYRDGRKDFSCHMRTFPGEAERFCSVIATPRFDRFNIFAPHAIIHNCAGKIMSDLARSPDDPLFWLHHSFVDLLWLQWQHWHSGFYAPPHSPPLDAPLRGLDGLARREPDQPTRVKDILNLEALEVAYEAGRDQLASRVVGKSVIFMTLKPPERTLWSKAKLTINHLHATEAKDSPPPSQLTVMPTEDLDIFKKRGPTKAAITIPLLVGETNQGAPHLPHDLEVDVTTLIDSSKDISLVAWSERDSGVELRSGFRVGSLSMLYDPPDYADVCRGPCSKIMRS